MYRLSRCVPLAHEHKTFQDAHQHADITNPKKPIMKFMITWQFHQGKLHEGYSQFFKMTPEQDAADRGSRIKQIGRWHDLARGRGVVICESDGAEAVANWHLTGTASSM
jgi:Protein of unknown function (DUF3303)